MNKLAVPEQVACSKKPDSYTPHSAVIMTVVAFWRCKSFLISSCSKPGLKSTVGPGGEPLNIHARPKGHPHNAHVRQLAHDHKEVEVNYANNLLRDAALDGSERINEERNI